MLKHKHIGIIKGKDSSTIRLADATSLRSLHSTTKVATANMFLNSGDLLYRRIPSNRRFAEGTTCSEPNVNYHRCADEGVTAVTRPQSSHQFP